MSCISQTTSSRLVELICENDHLHVLKSKNAKPNAAAARERLWSKIVDEVNAEGEGGPITVDQAKKHWQYKQGRAKVANAARKRYEFYSHLVFTHFYMLLSRL